MPKAAQARHKKVHSKKGHGLAASCQICLPIDLLPLVNKLQQACQFYQVVTSLLKSGLLQVVLHSDRTKTLQCYNLLKQFAVSPRVTRFDNEQQFNNSVEGPVRRRKMEAGNCLFSGKMGFYAIDRLVANLPIFRCVGTESHLK